MITVTSAKAQRHLDELIEQSQHEPIQITRRGRLESVLLRDKLNRYATPTVRRLFLDGLRQRVVMCPVTQTVNDCPDPKDNKFLALAETIEAELIIANDPHLTDLHPWRGISILPPTAFLAGTP